jgi:hypothetical protein
MVHVIFVCHSFLVATVLPGIGKRFPHMSLYTAKVATEVYAACVRFLTTLATDSQYPGMDIAIISTDKQIFETLLHCRDR